LVEQTPRTGELVVLDHPGGGDRAAVVVIEHAGERGALAARFEAQDATGAALGDARQHVALERPLDLVLQLAGAQPARPVRLAAARVLAEARRQLAVGEVVVALLAACAARGLLLER